MVRMLAERGWRGGWVGECGTFQHDRAPSQGSGRRLYGRTTVVVWAERCWSLTICWIFVVRGRFEDLRTTRFRFRFGGKTDLQHGLKMTIFDQNDPYKWNPVFGKDKTATCDSLVVNSELQSCT